MISRPRAIRSIPKGLHDLLRGTNAVAPFGRLLLFDSDKGAQPTSYRWNASRGRFREFASSPANS